MTIEVRAEEIEWKGLWVSVENAIPTKFPQNEYWVSSSDEDGYQFVFRARWVGGKWCDIMNPDQEIDQSDEKITHWRGIIKPDPPKTGNVIHINEESFQQISDKGLESLSKDDSIIENAVEANKRSSVIGYFGWRVKRVDELIMSDSGESIGLRKFWDDRARFEKDLEKIKYILALKNHIEWIKETNGS